MDDGVRKNLKIKPVEAKDVEQFNDLLRYVFQVTDKELTESGYEEGEIQRAKLPVLATSDVIGWFNEKNELVSQLAVYPCKVNIHGRIFEMGGLTGVGTYPEYAGQGLMHDLVKVALNHMKESGQLISYLYPYSIPFYRKKGWEIMSDHMTFELKDTQLPKVKDVEGRVERTEVDDKDIFSTYDKFAKKTHGSMIRNQLNWDEYWRWENEEERMAAIYYDKNNQPQGYIIYWIANEVFHIKELIYLKQEARVGLWNFISAHFSMIEKVRGNIYKDEPLAFLLDDGDIKETIEPYFMARIVDVKEFLMRYPFEEIDKDFHFKITDPLVDDNNGIFGIHWNKQGKIEVSNEPIGHEVKCDIQTLSTMLMSYKRPSYLKNIERLQATHNVVRELENIIPMETPYYSDYF
ncbi:GNAT family N-acetyltransferase [Companilactobacillus sp. DQM5]|uniref:GNAT family N-acetyltransferase n=1 Tax=Companilactobacillus sp. DQM5 TaxID=3463359 RepID=UPI004059BF81